MTTFPRIRLAVVAVAFGVVACSDSPTSPSSPNVPDVAALLAEMSPPALVQATAAASPAVGLFMSQSRLSGPTNCAFDAGTGFFVCPAVTVNGLTFTRRFRLLDASNNAQSQPSTQTVAIETQSTVKGTQTLNVRGAPAGSVTINHGDDMILSGIQTRQHTLNGTGQSLIDETLSVSSGSFQTHIEETDTTSNLLLPDAKAGQRWPQSGTIVNRQTITDALPGQPVFTTTTRAQITFNGTSVITITLTSPFGGTTTCQIDLANPGAGGTCS